MRRLPAAALPLAFLALPGVRVSFVSLIFVNCVRAPLLREGEREREGESLIHRLLSLGANRVNHEECKNNASGEDAHRRSHAACAAVEGAHHRQNQIESCYSHLWLHRIWYTSVGTFSFLFLSISLSISLFWFHLLPLFDLFCESVRWKKEHETRQYLLVFLIWIFLAGFVNVEKRLFRFREILALYANMLSQDFPSLDLSVFCGVYEEVLEDVLVSSVWTPAATA